MPHQSSHGTRRWKMCLQWNSKNKSFFMQYMIHLQNTLPRECCASHFIKRAVANTGRMSPPGKILGKMIKRCNFSFTLAHAHPHTQVVLNCKFAPLFPLHFQLLCLILYLYLARSPQASVMYYPHSNPAGRTLRWDTESHYTWGPFLCAKTGQRGWITVLSVLLVCTLPFSLKYARYLPILTYVCFMAAHSL